MVPVRTRPLFVALVAILAIALAAATLNTAVPVEGAAGGGGGGFGDQPGTGAGQQDSDEVAPFSFGFAGLAGAFPAIQLPCYPVLNDLRFLGALALVGGLGLYALYRRTGPLVPVAVVAAVGPPGLVVHALLTACRTAEAGWFGLPGAADPSGNLSGLISLFGGAGGAGSAAGGTPVASVALVGVLGLALLVAVALLLQSAGDDEPTPPAAPVTPADEPVAAIGRAAGRAADRIEADADPDNAVYRAWKEMTDRLDVASPETSTPAEFATVAVAAGMAADDVAELTGLFEAVRYGTAAPTADRESRAVAALRRIEATYAGDPS